MPRSHFSILSHYSVVTWANITFFKDPHYWSFVWRIYQISPHKGPVMRESDFTSWRQHDRKLSCSWCPMHERRASHVDPFWYIMVPYFNAIWIYFRPFTLLGSISFIPICDSMLEMMRIQPKGKHIYIIIGNSQNTNVSALYNRIF